MTYRCCELRNSRNYSNIVLWATALILLSYFLGLNKVIIVAKIIDTQYERPRSSFICVKRILQHEILGAGYLLSGLVLDKSVIGKIIRRDVMRESVTYQAVLEEGREEGRLAERRSIVMSLLQEGMAIDLITRVTGWSVAEVTQLKQDSGL
jgi:hypothetical protein